MDTHGWDIVSACRQDDLNKLLSKRMSKSPPSLKYSDKTGIGIDIVFDPWEISSFGNDDTLTLVMPIKSGSLKNTSKFATVPKVDLAGVQLEIAVKLDFVENAKGTASNLQFQFKKVGKSKDDKTKGAVWAINADLDGTLKKRDPSGNSATDLREHIPEVLIAHGDQLNYALSSLNLAPAAKQAWLKPIERHFMFAQGKKDAKGNQGPGHLVVALMVRDRPASTRSMTIDDALTDNDNPINMAFASDLFLEHLLMPALPASFKDPANLLFKFKGDKIQLFCGYNVNAKPGKSPYCYPAECATVDHWGTGYTPYLYPFVVSVDDDLLHVDASGTFDITGLSDSSVDFWFKQSLKPSFDASTQKLEFHVHGDTKSDYTKHIPAWIYIISAGAAALVGPLVAIIIAAVVDAVVYAVTTSVSQQISGAGGGSTNLGNLSAAFVEWPGSTAIDIEHAALETAFVVRGKIQS